MSRSHVALLSLCLAACGARTGLASPPAPDAGSDAGVPAAAETCDGRDEDLDGRVDEDLPPLTCGDERCAREAPSCLDGRPQVCPPVVPTEETCNRLDDDCDGRIDETLGFAPLGPPIVIRDVADERSGDCVQCSEVLDFQLVTFGRALHGVWHLFIAGTPDRPNTFARRLGDDGRPLERSRPLFDAITTRVALAPSHSGRTIASYCGRQEDGIDYPRSEFLGPDGAPLGIRPERGDADVRCTTETSVWWTGERHVFARERLTGGLSLERADRDGRSLGFELLDWPIWSGGFPTAFDGHRAYAFSATEWAPMMVDVLEVDSLGRPTRHTAFAPLPATTLDSSISGAGAVLADEHGVLVGFTRVTSTGTGREDLELEVLIHRYDPDERAFTALGSPLDSVVGASRLVRRGADEMLMVGVAGGRTFAGDPQVEVQRLTGEGAPLASWVLESPGDDGIRAVDVRAHLGRIFVGYVRVIDYGQTRVELLELGCDTR